MQVAIRLCVVAVIALGSMGLVAANHAADEQTLSAGWIGINDDIQYFQPGPEFKLQREAAAMKAYKSEAQQAGRQRL